jgi:putative tryptophan/tyrosine transport system substrate-binding protein
VTIEFRWAENQLERLPELAADLVRHRVSVIFARGGSNPSLAANAATSTIPVVFASGINPIDVGLVGSLNRPGGNITGITFLINTLAGKQLEVLYQLVPKAAVIAVLLNPQIPTARSQLQDIQAAARILGLQINVLDASTERDFDIVFASLVQTKRADWSVRERMLPLLTIWRAGILAAFSKVPDWGTCLSSNQLRSS